MKKMDNKDKIIEFQVRLIQLIFEMSESEKQDFLKKLESRKQSKLEEKESVK